MQIHDFENIDWLDTPPVAALQNAESLLDRLGATGKMAERLARYPLPLRLSRILVEAMERGVGEDGCVAAALLGSGARSEKNELFSAMEWMSSYRVFGAVDDKHLIYGFLVHGNTTGNTLPMNGNEPESLEPGSNEYDIFPCAAINYLWGKEGGQLVNLEQNDVAWQANDPFANPQDPAVNMHQLTLDMYTLSPSNGGLSGSIAIGFGGPGVTSNFIGIQIVNRSPPAQYKKHGGWASTSPLFSAYGDFGCIFCLYTVPDKFAKIYDNANSPEYSVWETNAAAGNLTVDQKNRRFRFTSNLRVDGRLSAYEVGPFGVTWGSGSNDPSGGCTTGSLFSNTAGAAGHVFWVCEGGGWVAK
jgi:hypothetical protein